ncbi:MAG TPA: LysR family transcriptional regulator [Candidatus Borkfalkia stercoripullorum]|nr:LysR family transcriptional regulator [Candidatus Borkfalkia stercoripullorum]
MNTESIKTFIMLSKLKNFTRTAERMYVAQSTVTNRIGELENETGKRLFVRKQGGVELTEEGELFLGYAERIAELEDTFIQQVNAAARYSKKLRIGTINAVYESELYPLVSGYCRNEPDVAVKVVLGHSADLLRMLQDDVVDVAFSYIPLKRAGFVCRKFSADEFVLLASPAANEYKRGITKEQLISSRYLMCNFAFGDAGEFVRSLFPPRHAFGFEIDNSSKVIDYLKDGLGYSFLPRKMAEREISAGELEIVQPVGFSAPEIVSYCSYKKGCEAAEHFLEMA